MLMLRMLCTWATFWSRKVVESILRAGILRATKMYKGNRVSVSGRTNWEGFVVLAHKFL